MGLTPGLARAEMFYVAPSGDDTAPGTETQPFATMERAQTAAEPGDTVYFRAGRYRFASTTAADGIVLAKSGQEGSPIRYWAYPGELPVFDFTGLSAQARITGLRVSANWLHVKGFEFSGVPQNLTTEHESWGIYNTGSHNTYEALDLHHHMGPGLFIARGGDNLVLNCDSHHNYDPKSSSGDGTNADGFGCHSETGAKGNVFRGCRAWWNSDDGFDLIQAQEPVIIEHSWAWKNGYQPDTMTGKADGNGFKAGGYGVPATHLPAQPPKHSVRFCLAFENRASGFYANHHPVPSEFYHDTALRNRSANFNMLGLEGNVGVLRNNLAYGGTLLANGDGSDVRASSWTLPVMVSDDDFLSVDSSAAAQPRQADGSLPVLAFARLQAASDLVDKGEDVGLPFQGARPDLGAFETGLPVLDEPEPVTAGASAAVGGAHAAAVGGASAAGVQSAAGSGGAGGDGGGGAKAPAVSAPEPRAGVSASVGQAGAAPSPQAGPPVESGCSCRVLRVRARLPVLSSCLWIVALARLARRRFRRCASQPAASHADTPRARPPSGSRARGASHSGHWMLVSTDSAATSSGRQRSSPSRNTF